MGSEKWKNNTLTIQRLEKIIGSYDKLSTRNDLHKRWSKIGEKVERSLRIMETLENKGKRKFRRLKLNLIEAYKIGQYIKYLYRMEEGKIMKLVETLRKVEGNLKRIELHLPKVNEFLGDSYRNENDSKIEDETIFNNYLVCLKKTIKNKEDFQNIFRLEANYLKKEDVEEEYQTIEDFTKKHESSKLTSPVNGSEITVNIPISFFQQICRSKNCVLIPTQLQSSLERFFRKIFDDFCPDSTSPLLFTFHMNCLLTNGGTIDKDQIIAKFNEFHKNNLITQTNWRSHISEFIDNFNLVFPLNQKSKTSECIQYIFDCYANWLKKNTHFKLAPLALEFLLEAK
ncbi:hypothetical protein SNEBB_001129 [Seison nebaliae]|nr:hypothetical protein SNEBB_001129 [Seison nebaliae]